jgi:hypothetical protein
MSVRGELLFHPVNGFTGNGFHKKSLLGKGYLTKDQYESRQNGARPLNDAVERNPTHVADELAKLAGLVKSGARTPAQ